jgi:hypothetical protein
MFLLLRLVILLCAIVAGAQVQSVGDVSFPTPDGWLYQQHPGDDHASLTLSQGGGYWVLAVYKAMRASGNAEQDFRAAWTKIAPHDPVPEPIYDHRSLVGYQGKYASQYTGDQQHYVWLYVLQSGRGAIPVLVITQNRQMFNAMQPMVLQVVEGVRQAGDKASPLKTTITLADLAGEWETGGESSLNYVDSATGAYAGSSTVAHGATYVIAANGSYTYKLAGVTGGRVVRDQGAGTVQLNNEFIVFRDRAKGTTSRYRFVSYQTAVNGATVLTLLTDNYEMSADAVSAYGEKWTRKNRP